MILWLDWLGVMEIGRVKVIMRVYNLIVVWFCWICDKYWNCFVNLMDLFMDIIYF